MLTLELYVVLQMARILTAFDCSQRTLWATIQAERAAVGPVCHGSVTPSCPATMSSTFHSTWYLSLWCQLCPQVFGQKNSWAMDFQQSNEWRKLKVPEKTANNAGVSSKWRDTSVATIEPFAIGERNWRNGRLLYTLRESAEDEFGSRKVELLLYSLYETQYLLSSLR